MKTEDDLLDEVRQFEAEHAYDRDSGYGMVRRLRAYRAQLASAECALFERLLLRLIREQHPTLWWVALEVLAQDEPPGNAAALANLLAQNRDLPKEVIDYLVYGLLRLRYSNVPFDRYVDEALQERRPMALPNLAALALVDPARSVERASRYFADELAAGSESRVEAAVPAFVQQYTSVSDTLLVDLVAKTSTISASTGRALQRIVGDYVSKPWIVRKLGAHRSADLLRELQRAAAS